MVRLCARIESNARDLVAIPVFTGDRFDLRPWLDWMENRFVLGDYTDFEKLHLAHGFIEGDAHDFVRDVESVMPYRNWNAMKELLLSAFGTDDDPERISLVLERERRWEKLQQSFQEKQSFQQRQSEKIQKISTMVAEESLTKEETIPVAKAQQLDFDSEQLRNNDLREVNSVIVNLETVATNVNQEKESFQVMESNHQEWIPQVPHQLITLSQVTISTLEPSQIIRSEDLGVLQDLPSVLLGEKQHCTQTA